MLEHLFNNLIFLLVFFQVQIQYYMTLNIYKEGEEWATVTFGGLAVFMRVVSGMWKDLTGLLGSVRK